MLYGTPVDAARANIRKNEFLDVGLRVPPGAAATQLGEVDSRQHACRWTR